jgi:phosphoenolpyruvate-protein phosphotransferase (PTS system enzyme I)
MKRLKGIAASPGIAIGPAFVYHPVDLVIQRQRADDPAAEWARYQAAVAEALQELTTLRQKAVAEVGEAEAAIFDAHQMILRDPDLEEELHAEMQAGASAEAAVQTVFKRATETFATMDDPLFRERAIDFADVGQRVLQRLLGVRSDSLAVLTRPAIVVAHDLMPSDTAQMNKAMVRGFCTAAGGPLSHTAILARNLGLPAVVGAGEGVMEIAIEAPLIVDGTEGVIVAEASEGERTDYERRARALAEARVTAEAAAHEPAITRDGRQVEVVANIGLPGEEAAALKAGAEGIGLLRTEFLFVDRQTAPSEDEQFRAYRPILEAMGPRPVIARTMDIGGDKPAAFLAMPHEDNPFLGWRAIRIGLAQPELLKTQLRALLRAGQGGNLKIMFPMVATVEEMRAARALVEEARAELRERGQAFAEAVEVGMMVEIPSAALIADLLTPHVDFFSIGSNDLTQYTLAADRGNPAVASLFDSLHPAVLRLVDNVIRAAHAANVWVGMCGEMAGDLTAIPILLGLGLDEFSMGAAAVPPAKALIRKLSIAEMRSLAQEALAQPTAPAVRGLVNRRLTAKA